MSSLTPEKRMDKTGKLVTRHVKMETASGNARPKLPPPASLSTSKESIILPEDKITPMRNEDFSLISDVLDLCGNDGYDLMQVTQYIREGDLDALRVFKKYGHMHPFSTITDVLQQTEELFKDDPPENYESATDAHMKIATSGKFEYCDINGNPDYEKALVIIHENLDKTDSILQFLNERGVDPEGLTEYIANKVTPLRDGTL